MESPVFKLEKVVHSRSEEMQDFEGPLDLILFLLGKNKLEIQDISISLICGQYIAWLEDRQRMDLEVASEFVIMASHLVYLKTRRKSRCCRGSIPPPGRRSAAPAPSG